MIADLEFNRYIAIFTSFVDKLQYHGIIQINQSIDYKHT